MWPAGRTAERTVVKLVVGTRSLGRLFGRQVQRLRRQLVEVILVTELRGTVAAADRQIHALAGSVPVGELPIEVPGIGRILVAKPVPALPQPIDVGVME